MTRFLANILQVVLFFSLVPLNLFAIENLKFERIDDRNGLSSDFVSSIVQDQEGYMWFATSDGLNRYDGYSVKQYKNRLNGELYFESSVFDCIEIAKDGKLWLGTKYNGIQIFDPKTETVTNISKDTLNGLYINDNQIQDLLCDSHGRIWIATYHGVSRYNPETNKIRTYQEDEKNPQRAPLGNVTCIYEDSQGRILFGTWENGLYVYNEANDSFRNYSIKQNIFSQGKNARIWSFLEDKNGYTWIGTWETGLLKIRIAENSVEYLNHFYFKPENKNNGLSDNIIFSLQQTPDNSIWVGTSKGLNIITNPGIKNPEILTYTDGQETNLPSNSEIYELKQDVSGSMWLATMGGGVNKVDLKRYRFELFNIMDLNSPVKSQVVYSIFPLNENELLLGIRALGVGVYNLEKKTFKGFNELSMFDGFPSNLIDMNAVYCILKDSRENLWIGTRYIGLYKKDAVTGKWENIIPRTFFSPGAPISAPISINCILEDNFNCLWVGTSEGLIKLVYMHENNSYKTYKYLPEKGNSTSIGGKNITSLLIDSEQTLWIATEDGGISRLTNNLKDHSGLKFENYNYSPQSKLRLNSNSINVIVEDNKNRIWLGTGTNSIIQYDRKTNSFKYFNSITELIGNTVYNLIPDDFGAIWATTNKGLVRLVIENEEINIQNFTSEDGLQSNIFNRGASYKDSKGRIYIGGIYGFNRFNPIEFKPNNYVPPVVISEIEINNKPAEIGRIKNNRLVLLNNENNFSIEFSALSYSQAKKNKFSRKLDGFDDDWIMSDYSNRKAVYTNVPPGKYTFMVKAANNSWIWNPEPIELTIIVKPSPFLSRLAFSIYLLLFLGILYLIFWYRMRNLKIQQALQIEKIERVKNENINEFKLRFFTNISHELLTPLSIISCGIEDFKEVPNVDKKNLHSLSMNVDRLITLINQLLDFRKIETGNMQLNLKSSQIDEIFIKLKESYLPLAKSKNIDFHVVGEVEEKIYCDIEKIETILTNLVSNAFKYSNKNGTVKVKYSVYETDEKEFLEFSVKDSGIGIKDSDINHIFDRFYQVNSVTGRTFGAGIGLHLVKNLVDLQKGTIEVKSEKEGNGTIFTIKIPLDRELFESNEEESRTTSHLINDFPVMLDEDVNSPDAPVSDYLNLLSKKNNFNVLVVEDNDDLRKLICRQLSMDYEVSEASNGIEGYETACKMNPDLIVCDVMMPGMSGFEMCNKLKGDINYSHIMIVLLTAKVTNDDRYEGYLAGADSYLTKPLDIKLLKARIHSLKRQREIIKEKYSTGISPEYHPEELSAINVDFMKEIVSSIMEEIGNPEFNVTMLTEKVRISHSTLYRKIQSITGMSPNEFIRNIRITEAAKLMGNKNANISEIAIQVGFNDHSYFTRCFKNKFNKTPKQYVANL